jgi:hypothetical protein
MSQFGDLPEAQTALIIVLSLFALVGLAVVLVIRIKMAKSRPTFLKKPLERPINPFRTKQLLPVTTNVTNLGYIELQDMPRPPPQAAMPHSRLPRNPDLDSKVTSFGNFSNTVV